jgi:hypothetical protein
MFDFPELSCTEQTLTPRKECTHGAWHLSKTPLKCLAPTLQKLLSVEPTLRRRGEEATGAGCRPFRLTRGLNQIVF